MPNAFRFRRKQGSCRSRMSFQKLRAFFTSDLWLDFALRPYRASSAGPLNMTSAVPPAVGGKQGREGLTFWSGFHARIEQMEVAYHEAECPNIVKAKPCRRSRRACCFLRPRHDTGNGRQRRRGRGRARGPLAVGALVGSAAAQPRYYALITRRRPSMCQLRAAGLNMSACGTVTDTSFNASASASRTPRSPDTVH